MRVVCPPSQTCIWLVMFNLHSAYGSRHLTKGWTYAPELHVRSECRQALRGVSHFVMMYCIRTLIYTWLLQSKTKVFLATRCCAETDQLLKGFSQLWQQLNLLLLIQQLHTKSTHLGLIHSYMYGQTAIKTTNTRLHNIFYFQLVQFRNQNLPLWHEAHAPFLVQSDLVIQSPDITALASRHQPQHQLVSALWGCGGMLSQQHQPLRPTQCWWPSHPSQCLLAGTAGPATLRNCTICAFK